MTNTNPWNARLDFSTGNPFSVRFVPSRHIANRYVLSERPDGKIDIRQAEVYQSSAVSHGMARHGVALMALECGSEPIAVELSKQEAHEWLEAQFAKPGMANDSQLREFHRWQQHLSEEDRGFKPASVQARLPDAPETPQP